MGLRTGQQPSLAVNIAGVEPVGQDIDSPGSIPSDDALEVGDYEESFESDLNSDDIAAEEVVGQFLISDVVLLMVIIFVTCITCRASESKAACRPLAQDGMWTTLVHL